MKDNTFVVTQAGELFFNLLQITCEDLMKLKRQFAKPCLDWTEREFHLAGSLGTSLLTYMLEHRLLLRSKKTPRVVILTQQGKDWLKNNLEIRF